MSKQMAGAGRPNPNQIFSYKSFRSGTIQIPYDPTIFPFGLTSEGL